MKFNQFFHEVLQLKKIEVDVQCPLVCHIASYKIASPHHASCKHVSPIFTFGHSIALAKIVVFFEFLVIYGTPKLFDLMLC